MNYGYPKMNYGYPNIGMNSITAPHSDSHILLTNDTDSVLLVQIFTAGTTM